MAKSDVAQERNVAERRDVQHAVEGNVAAVEDWGIVENDITRSELTKGVDYEGICDSGGKCGGSGDDSEGPVGEDDRSGAE